VSGHPQPHDPELDALQQSVAGELEALRGLGVILVAAVVADERLRIDVVTERVDVVDNQETRLVPISSRPIITSLDCVEMCARGWMRLEIPGTPLRAIATSGRQDSNLRPLVPQTSTYCSPRVRVQLECFCRNLVGKSAAPRKLETAGIGCN
jgi:hypothetical protein